MSSPELRKSNARTKDNIVLAPAPVSRRQEEGESDITSSVERAKSARPSQPVRSRFDFEVRILEIFSMTNYNFFFRLIMYLVKSLP